MDNQNKPPRNTHQQSPERTDRFVCRRGGSLYGALSVAEFVDVFNHYEDDKTDLQEAPLALQRYLKLKPDEAEYSVFGDIIAGPTLFPDDSEDDAEALHLIRMEQKGKPRYLPPSKEEFLKFADALYIEPEKPYAELNAYVLKNKLRSKEGIDGDMLNLHEMIQDRVEPAGILQYFIDTGYALHEIDEINAFMQRLMTAYNNTRIFENNGYTPNELGAILAKNRPIEPVIHQPKKVGRNDPCPCGSGKKFKTCCALLENSRAAQLTHSECKLFYETWYKLLDYVNSELKVVDYKFSLSYPEYHDETLLHKIREQLWKKPKLISEFIAEADKRDVGRLTEEETSLLKSWEKHHVKWQFVLLKYTPDAAILMRMDKGKAVKLYAVKGMTTSIAEAMHRKLPVMLDTVLLPFGDKIVYDSFMASQAIEFGGGVMDMLEGEYAEAEKKYGIISKL